ncbi:MAG: asparagine synthase C-terminal domain-containing protein [Candidatus Nitrosotenuis sp.]
MDVKLNKKLIRNFLTMRFNPEDVPSLQLAKPIDLITKTSDQQGHKTEKLLMNSILKKKTESNTYVVSLSSGIDSTLCLALLRKTFPDSNIWGICAVFQNAFDESKRAEKIAKRFDAYFKVLPIKSIFQHMPQLIAISGKPRWNTYQHYIAKEARKYSNVLIVGDGADELFGGYTFRYNKFLTLNRAKDNWRTKTINYLECHNRDWVPDQEHMFGRSIKFSWDDTYEYFRKYFSNRLEPLKQLMLADYNGKLIFDFIPTTKSILEHYKLKDGTVFLDHDVIKFSHHLPLQEKYDQKNGKGKLVLREIAKRLKIDHLNEKRGFSPDLFYDWQKNGKRLYEKYLIQKDSVIFTKKIINNNWVIRSFEKIENDGDIRYLNRIISILALEIWLRIFITKEMKPTKQLI